MHATTILGVCRDGQVMFGDMIVKHDGEVLAA